MSYHVQGTSSGLPYRAGTLDGYQPVTQTGYPAQINTTGNQPSYGPGTGYQSNTSVNMAKVINQSAQNMQNTQNQPSQLITLSPTTDNISPSWNKSGQSSFNDLEGLDFFSAPPASTGASNPGQATNGPTTDTGPKLYPDISSAFR